ncbi:S-layer homology domain-containing protein [Paenibacillus soyae]|uniref:S-layer homology domain-containing protein n=1 Tax=Paenibacillus soyae TaxID=2969249 RepID=A0A9X2S9Y1_9BACL|nr:S-layer homology domain-containing protein [Paenibacillus soyae]MCR2805954.1 S-layer homology domain-containing protein [Paenibacillus soyae]
MKHLAARRSPLLRRLFGAALASSILLTTVAAPISGFAAPIQEAAETSASSLSASGAPELTGLPAYATGEYLMVAGTAAPNAAVTLYVGFDGQEPGYYDQTFADENGSFSISLYLDTDGVYTLEAVAELEGAVSPPSERMTVIADRSVPGDIIEPAWDLIGNTSLLLRWSPPDSVMEPIRYRIYDSNGGLLAETQETSYAFEGLEPSRSYVYDIRVADDAGNESPGAFLYAGTSPLSETKLVEGVSFLHNRQSETALSADGSTLAYVDTRLAEKAEAASGTAELKPSLRPSNLYAADTETKETKLLSVKSEGQPWNDVVLEPSTSADGSVTAFVARGAYAPDDAAPGLRHVYRHDSASGETMLVSEPDSSAGEPSISGDGMRIAYIDNGNVYLYDQANPSQRRLISRTSGGEPSAAWNGNPVISEDGHTIAFLTEASNLDGGEEVPPGSNAIAVYSLLEDGLAGFFPHESSSGNISISADGRYIAYTRAADSYLERVFLLDVDEGTDTSLYLNAPPDQLDRKSYDGGTAISGDGQYVFSGVSDYDPELPGVRSYIERFDRETGQVTRVGNPARQAWAPVIDSAGNRVAYWYEDAIYTSCFGDCGDAGSGDPIVSASWTADGEHKIGQFIKPGGEIDLVAYGRKDQTVEAVIRYKSANVPEMQEMSVPLSADARAPETYRGSFELTRGITEVESIVVKPAGAASGGKALASLPELAGILNIEIYADRPERLDLARLLIQAPGENVGEWSISSSQMQYELFGPPRTELSVSLVSPDGQVVLASQSGVITQSGLPTSVTLSPEYLAHLNISVLDEREGTALSGVPVFFRDSSGSLIAETVTDASGHASLPGGGREGARILVSVEAPNTHMPAEAQSLSLRLGTNGLIFRLESKKDTVQSVSLDFDREVGPAWSAAPVIGSRGIVRASAGPGLALQAKILHTLQGSGMSTENAEKLIPLTEVSPGEYEGAPFLVEEGMVRIDSIRIQIGDTWSDTVYPVGKQIAARIRTSIRTPEGLEWSGTLGGSSLYLQFNDRSGKFYTDRTTLGANQTTYAFDVPFTSESYPYSISLTSGTGPIVATKADIKAAKPGTVYDAEIIPTYRMTLSGSVKDEAGKLQEAKYTLVDDQGQALASGETWGSYSITFGAKADTTVRLRITPKNADYAPTTVEAVMDRPSLTADAVLTKRPQATLSGTVYAKDGTPAKGVNVRATVVQEGYSKVYDAISQANGTYTLSLPAGDVEVRATSYQERLGSLSPLHKTSVAAGETETADLRLMENGRIGLKLFIRKDGGNWEGPLEIDPSLMRYYSIHASYPIMAAGDPLEVRAVSGDTVRLCVSGAADGLPTTCQLATLDQNNEAALEFRLEDLDTEVSFQALNPDGSVARSVRAAFIRTDGSTESYYDYADVGPPGRTVKLSKPGTYNMIINENAEFTGAVQFTIAEGQRLQLGNIRLEPKGKFGGLRGNAITASTDQIAQGGSVDVRVTYNNTGLPSGAAANARLIVELPPETSLEAGSLVLNGRPLAAAPVGRLLDIPMGLIEHYDNGFARFRLRIDENSLAESAFISAKIRYDGDGGTKEERIGDVQVQLYAATLRAPEQTTRRSIRVSGYAPPGEEVTVYADTLALGRAAASPQGFWSMSVELPDNGMRFHRLRTETTLAGKRLSGQNAVVQFITDDPGLEQISMKMAGGGELKTFKPEDGTAVFPYIVEPGNPFTFRLTFRDPDRVYDVRVQFGSGSVEAKRNGDEYVAVVRFPEKLGPLYVTYQTQSDPSELYEPAPSEAYIRNTLPESLAGFETEWAASAGEKTPDGRTVAPNSLETRIELTEGVWANVKLAREEVPGFEPSEQDILRAERSGRSVYGLSFSRSQSGGPAEMSLSAYFPGRDSGNVVAKGSSNTSKLALSDTARTTINLTIDAMDKGTKVYDTWKTVNSVLDPGVFERIDKDLEIARNICDTQAAEYYTNMALQIRFDIAAHEIAKTVIGGIGNLLPGWGSVLFWGESQWAGKELDQIIEDELKELEDHLKQYDCSKVKPWKAPDADPVYIWDPSGYVYEGLPSNRIEGATATALYLEDGQWKVWDAEWFGQINPQRTDGEGRYGWDVPAGMWKVRYEKDGYETAYSDELEVPPPRFEVNIPLTSYAPPEVSYVLPEPGGRSVEIGFTKPMLVESVSEDSVSVARSGGGQPVSGSVTAKQPEQSPEGLGLTEAIVFTPDTPLASGVEYELLVGGQLASYAGTALDAPYLSSFTSLASDDTPPSAVENLTGSMEGATAILVWESPEEADGNGAYIRYRTAGSAAYSAPIAIEKGKHWAEIEGLEAGSVYDFQVTSVDLSGNESNCGCIRLEEYAPGPDLTPPLAAGQVEASDTGNGRLRVTWNDPLAEDLAGLRLSWFPADRPADSQSVQVRPGSQSYSIEGLKPSTRYTISLTAYDDEGNFSAAAVVTAATAPSSGGNPDPNQGGGQTGGEKPDPGAAGKWEIGSEGGRFEAFEGRLKLMIPHGIYADGVQVKWSELKDDESKPSDDYIRYSPTYRLESSGKAQEGGRLKLTITHDPLILIDFSPRELGLYRKDPGADGGWTYVGGGVLHGTGFLTSEPELDGEYAIMRYTPRMDDLNSHWSKPEIGILLSRHIVQGVAPGRFEPNRSLTRAEAATMLMNMIEQLGIARPAATRAAEATTAGTGFSDVRTDAWYAEDVRAAAELGLVKGSEGRFRPNEPITREELVTLLVRAATLLGYNAENGISADETLRPFQDAAAVSAWARDAISAAAHEGWLRGDDSSRLKPGANTTRAEAGALLLRIMELLTQEADA